MAKTFTAINGDVYEIDLNLDFSTSYNEDIITGKVTGYFVENETAKIPVEKEIYEAVTAYLETL